MRRPRVVRLLRLPHLIRFRLTLWYTGLAALVLAAFVGSVFFAFSHYQFDSYAGELSSDLQSTMQQQLHVQTYYSGCPRAEYYGAGVSEPCYSMTLSIKDPNALTTGDTQIQYYKLNGQPLPTTKKGTNDKPPSALNSSAAVKARKQMGQQAAKSGKKSDSGSPVVTNNGQQLILTIPLSYGGEQIIGQITGPVNKVEQQVDHLKHLLVYIAGVLLALSALGGWMLAGRALRPIDEITRRARQITAHDLSQRLNIDQEDELGRMAATFDDMIARLEEAFERQKRFTSDASHELRTPLTVMQADLSLALARPRAAEEYRQTLVSMDEEVSRLSAIVGDLLMLTRIDVDPAGMQHQPVALHEMLQGLASRVRVIAAERGIAVRADHLEPVTIMGDATRLRQLFTNLLDNAVTYTPDGGRVTVTVERTREGARVQVSDTGIGIDAEYLPRIFERFYRTDEARQHNAQGTGLGLAISRSVVQAHHGEIGVQSAVGKGTTFTVTLPSDGRKRTARIRPLRTLVPRLVASD